MNNNIKETSTERFSNLLNVDDSLQIPWRFGIPILHSAAQITGYALIPDICSAKEHCTSVSGMSFLFICRNGSFTFLFFLLNIMLRNFALKHSSKKQSNH